MTLEYENVLKAEKNFALVILNESLNGNKSENKLFKKLWSKAKKKIIVDGAGNWLYENYSNFNEPDYICGDLDSIKEEALNFFKEKGKTEIIALKDQDHTDFTKTINFCIDEFKIKNNEIDYIIAVWGLTNRIDHNLSCINTLIKNIGRIPIFLLDVNNSLSWVIDKQSEIKTNDSSEWCSLVPVGEPTIISTTGFKWNMNNLEMRFGKLISTSNEFSKKEKSCSVNCSTPVFFTMHFP